MPLLETHVRPACVGIGALGLLRLASMRGSPGKLNIAVPSVKKSTYFEPTTCARFSAGFPLAWLTDEVAGEALAVDVALSVVGAMEVEVAVVDAASAAIVLDADVERFELEVSARLIVGSVSVDVALVVVAVNAATKAVLKAKVMSPARSTPATVKVSSGIFTELDIARFIARE
jgi:hypothetical protein